MGEISVANGIEDGFGRAFSDVCKANINEGSFSLPLVITGRFSDFVWAK